MADRWDSRQVAMWWAKMLSIAFGVAAMVISCLLWLFSNAYSLATKDYVDTSIGAVELHIESLETKAHAVEQYGRIESHLDRNSKELRQVSDNMLILGERLGVRRKMEAEHDGE